MKKLLRLVSLFIIACMLLSYLPVFTVSAAEDIYFENFESFTVGEKVKGFSASNLMEDKGNKFLKITTDRYGITNTITKFIMGEYCLSFDIASEKSDFSGTIKVMAGGTSERKLLSFTDGHMYAANGRSLGKITNKFRKVTICVNPVKRSMRLYVDQKCYFNGVYIEVLSDKCSSIKFTFSSNNDSQTSVYLDNITLHSSTVKTDKCFIYNPAGYVKNKKTTILTSQRKIDATYGSDNEQIESVKYANTIHLRSGLMHIKGEKVAADYVPIKKDDIYFVTPHAIETLTGAKAVIDGNKVTFGGSVKLTEGSLEMNSSGKKVTLAVAPFIKDGVWYLPIEDVIKNGFNMPYVFDCSVINGGFAVIGDSAFNVPGSETNLNKLNDYLFYYRPTPEEIAKDYAASPLNGQHPRIMIDKEGVEKIKNSIPDSERKQAWYKKLIEAANAATTYEPLIYEYRDGARLMAVASAYREYITILGMAYLLTGDAKYADAAWVQTEAVASFPDWNPAHHMDVGIMSMAFSLAYDWMYDYWTPEQKKIMEEAAYENCFWVAMESYMGTKNDMQGTIHQNNHNTVVNSGLSMLAFAMMDIYPEYTSFITSNAIRSIEYMIENFAPFGSYIEGPSYASITIDYLSTFMATYESVLGNLYSLKEVEGISYAPDFLVYDQSDVGCFNYGDAEFGFATSPGLFYLFDLYDIKGAKQSVANHSKYSSYTSALAFSLLWYGEEESEDNKSYNLDVFYDDINLVTTRDSYNPGQIFTAFKGGPTNPTTFNADMDMGSFVYDAMGVRWIYDMGKDQYELPGYMRPQDGRWNIFRKRSESHNTLAINPDEKPQYTVYTEAKVEDYVSKPAGMKAVVNLSECLQARAEYARRGFMLTENRTDLVIRDEFKVSKSSDIYTYMYINCDYEIDGNKITLIDKNDPDKKVVIEYTSSSKGEVYVEDAAPLSTAPVVVGQLDNGGFKRVVYKLKGSGEVSVTALITPLIYKANNVKKYDAPIDTWTIPDGELKALPTLDSLVIGGVEYDVTSRHVKVPCENEDSPVLDIEATSSKYIVEIVKGETVSDKHYVYIASPDSPDTKYVYSISYEPKRKRVVLNGYDTVAPNSIRVTEEPQPENPAVNAIDGNLATRWSAERDQSVLLDFNELTEFDTLAMAMYMGNERTNDIEVYVSADGETYEKVFAGTTSGLTSDFEMYDLGSQKAKFVRVDFHGNSKGTWNSVSEITLAKKK